MNPFHSARMPLAVALRQWLGGAFDYVSHEQVKAHASAPKNGQAPITPSERRGSCDSADTMACRLRGGLGWLL